MDNNSIGMDTSSRQTSPSNCTSTSGITAPEDEQDLLLYQVLGCILYTTCAIVGIVGNALVIYVVARVRGMKTLTNFYLVSVACADLLVLVGANLPAIPELFVEYSKWLYGSAMCSFLVYLQYLGINVSALSITAFTLERYIGICHPFTAQVWSTSSRVKRIIAGLWIFCSLSNGGWLYLATTVEEKINGELVKFCSFRIERRLYAIIYTIDLLLFYVLPLLLIVVLYSLIGLTLHRSTHALRRPSAAKLCRSSNPSTKSAVEKLITDPAVQTELPSQKTSDDGHREHLKKVEKSRQQVVKMLVVVAALFAILWLPYRALVVYNSFVKEEDRYLDKWFLLAAKTMVFVNNAMNPILYSIISKKFRQAFVRHTCLGRFVSTDRSIKTRDSMLTTITTSSKKEGSPKADCTIIMNKIPDSSTIAPARV